MIIHVTQQFSLINDSILIIFFNLFMYSANCESFQYIHHNLHDYCTDKHWSDFPGHMTISAEKSLQIRNPLIFNLNTNSSTKFVSYCLIRLIAAEGKRIYAVGTSSGISTNGKHWFTESMHFTPTGPKILTQKKVKEDFERTTDNNQLEIVFEQLGQQDFKFQLIVTPFRLIANYTNCLKDVEFKCFNNRCIDKYLICDNHNNCGDSSDEWLHCLTKLEVDIQTTTTESTTLPTTTTTTKWPVVLWPTKSTPGEDKGNSSLGTDNFFLFSLFKNSVDLQTILFYILIVLVIIVIVTLFNLIIWCLVTKRDQSFLDMSA